MKDTSKLTNEKLAERKNELHSWILSFPALLWLSFFFLIPYILIFVYSFFTPDIYETLPILSLEAYKEVLSTRYLQSYWTSIKFAIYTTGISLLLGYPTAYFMARSSEKLKNVFLVFIIIPFWTNFVIRIFSWRIFLAPHGVLSNLLIDLSIIDTPLRLLRTDFAVLLVMVYVYLPYMILPLYSVLEKMDFTLLDTAMDLGAKPLKAFINVTLPLSKQGIFAGAILVFIPALGTYIIPQLIGHQHSLFIGQVITYKIKNIPRSWPIASALSFILVVFIFALLLGCYYLNLRMKKHHLEYTVVNDPQSGGIFSGLSTPRRIAKHSKIRINKEIPHV